MNDTRLITSQLLKQFLSSNSHELGARLKQHLNTAFIARGLGNFDEKSLGFSKFSDYLLRVHGDLVSVNRDDSVSDILVSLRSSTAPQPSTLLSQAQTSNDTPSPTVVIRSDVWQAFANPDPERKRFFEKDTGKIVHYLTDKQAPERVEVESSPDRFLEIHPISQETQVAWMKDFLNSISLPANEKAVLETLIAKPYSSALNVTFSRALGSHTLAWRAFRTQHVTAIIEQWAHDSHVPPAKLHVTAAEPTVGTPKSPLKDAVKAGASSFEMPETSTTQLPPRQQVMKLLELLSDEDITKLVLPTLLSTILIKSRM